MWKTCLVIAGLACATPAQVVRLATTADTTADELLSAQNFGADPEVRLGSQISSVWWAIDLRGYFQFDLTPVGELGLPVRATFRWYQWRTGWNAAGRETGAFRVTGAWSEHTLTWSNLPTDDAQQLGAQVVGGQSPLGWREWDVTPLVQGWLTGAYPNFGIVVRHPIEAQVGGGNFDVATGIGPSREHSFAQPRPHLDLDFGSTFGHACATVGDPSVLAFGGGAPRRGHSFTLRTTGLPVGSLPTLLLGTNNVWWRGPLPLDLARFGFPSCWLLVAPEVQVAFPRTTTVAFDALLAVPADPTLLGVPLFAQTAAAGPAGSLHMSNGFGSLLY